VRHTAGDRREALAGQEAWLVGGAVRDRLLGRPLLDLDLAVPGDPAAAAKAVARAARGPAFELSDAFGAWRVHGPGHAWQVDVVALRGDSIEADLALRDFTLNAIAEPLAGGEPVDPFGGREDLAARRLRAWATARSPTTRCASCGSRAWPASSGSAPTTRRPPQRGRRRRGCATSRRSGSSASSSASSPPMPRWPASSSPTRSARSTRCCPELTAMRGLEQTIYHHRDALGHTLEVLERAIELETDPPPCSRTGARRAVARLLRVPARRRARPRHRPALRRAAAHAAERSPPSPNPKGASASPPTTAIGADLVDDLFVRQKDDRRTAPPVAALTRHHLKPGYLVAHRPLDRRTIHAYLKATEPFEADVVLLSSPTASRPAGASTRRRSPSTWTSSTSCWRPALDWHEHGPRPPLVRGDELARELGIDPGRVSASCSPRSPPRSTRRDRDARRGDQLRARRRTAPR
jgi:hypothetical protein